MPKSRSTVRQGSELHASASAGQAARAILPLPEYLAKQGVLTCLLLSSTLFLPQTTWLKISPVVRTSTDRPELPFMAAITGDPAKSMLCDVGGVMTCMLWWTPTLRTWWSPQRAVERQARVQDTLRRLSESSVATLFSTLVFTIVMFAMGASLESHAISTVLFALHLSLLVVWPVVYTVGIGFVADSRTSTRYQVIRMFCDFRCESSLERALVYPAVGAVIGAVIGAAVFPLDWDRPWQAFPLPSALGSTLGYALGGYVCWLQGAVAVLSSAESKTK